jgi:hypothetical protein
MHSHEQSILSLSPVIISAVGLIVTIYIAYRQYRATRDEQKLKLYERRLRIYMHVSEYISWAVRDADVDHARSAEMLQNTRESIFLFGKETQSYLFDIYKAGVNLHATSLELKGPLPIGERRNQLAAEHAALMIYFGNQLKDLHLHFNKHLNLESIS